MSQLAYQRNVATIERLAREVLTQCGHYRRNKADGHDEPIRFLLIEDRARNLGRVASSAAKRWRREHPL